MTNMVSGNHRRLPRVSASWAGTGRIHLRLPGPVMVVTHTTSCKEQFQWNRGRKGLGYSGKGEKLSVWLDIVKCTPHFEGLVDF